MTEDKIYSERVGKTLKIKSLTGLPSGDNSKQFRMMSEKRHVDFAILDGELCAHTWQAEGEGRLFLNELEQYASNHHLKLTIPTVLNPRLQAILEQNGYTMMEVPFRMMW